MSPNQTGLCSQVYSIILIERGCRSLTFIDLLVLKRRREEQNLCGRSARLMPI
jgi:hypothetical protein